MEVWCLVAHKVRILFISMSWLLYRKAVFSGLPAHPHLPIPKIMLCILLLILAVKLAKESSNLHAKA